MNTNTTKAPRRRKVAQAQVLPFPTQQVAAAVPVQPTDFSLVWSTGELDSATAVLNQPKRPGGMKALKSVTLAGAKCEAFLALSDRPANVQRLEIYQGNALICRCAYDPETQKWSSWTTPAPHYANQKYNRFAESQLRVETYAREADATRKRVGHLERNEPWPTIKKRGFLGIGRGTKIDNPAHETWEKSLKQSRDALEHHRLLTEVAARGLAEKIKDWEYLVENNLDKLEPPTGDEAPAGPAQSQGLRPFEAEHTADGEGTDSKPSRPRTRG